MLTRRWPSVEGCILRAGTEKTLDIPSGEEAGGSQIVRYLPIIEYEYTVGDVVYRETTIRAGPAGIHSRQATAPEEMPRYRSDTAVYYNPCDPSRAVLDRAIGLRDFLPITIGIRLVALGFLPLL